MSRTIKCANIRDALALRSLLEEQGVQVRQPDEVAPLSMVASGDLDRIKAAVAQLGNEFPRSGPITIEGEPGDDRAPEPSSEPKPTRASELDPAPEPAQAPEPEPPESPEPAQAAAPAQAVEPPPAPGPASEASPPELTREPGPASEDSPPELTREPGPASEASPPELTREPGPARAPTPTRRRRLLLYALAAASIVIVAALVDHWGVLPRVGAKASSSPTQLGGPAHRPQLLPPLDQPPV